MTSCRACGAMISANVSTCRRCRTILTRTAVAPVGLVALLGIMVLYVPYTAIGECRSKLARGDVDGANKFGRDTMQNPTRGPRDRHARAAAKAASARTLSSPGKGRVVAAPNRRRDPRSASGRGNSNSCRMVACRFGRRELIAGKLGSSVQSRCLPIYDDASGRRSSSPASIGSSRSLSRRSPI